MSPIQQNLDQKHYDFMDEVVKAFNNDERFTYPTSMTDDGSGEYAYFLHEEAPEVIFGYIGIIDERTIGIYVQNSEGTWVETHESFGNFDEDIAWLKNTMLEFLNSVA